MALGGKVRDSQKLQETVMEMKQLHGTGRVSERHVTTPWDRRENERQPATIGESERYATKSMAFERH